MLTESQILMTMTTNLQFYLTSARCWALSNTTFNNMNISNANNNDCFTVQTLVYHVCIQPPTFRLTQDNWLQDCRLQCTDIMFGVNRLPHSFSFNIRNPETNKSFIHVTKVIVFILNTRDNSVSSVCSPISVVVFTACIIVCSWLSRSVYDRSLWTQQRIYWSSEWVEIDWLELTALSAQ